MVTVNDYLATRDSEWMGQLHRFLGLTVGRVGPDIEDAAAKREAYSCDVTYGTNTEFGFDYLRDNMARSKDAMVQRGHRFAIVDEVDSILIDEARTPLIISGPAAESAQLYYQFAGIVRTLRAEDDYEVDEEKRIVVPTEAGIEKVERQLGVGNLYDAVAVNYVHHLTQALLAKELYRRDKDYLVAEGEVKIVDEFTGRTLDGRRWSDGLHQAVEAKERVRIKEENHTWATVTLQNYFRLYEKLSGMTGTAETEASEFANTYELPVVPIPPNKPLVRADNPDLIYKSEDAKFAAVVDDIDERHAEGQPVLVGTASVSKSEHLSRLLEKRGIPHEVLNAKQHFREAEIVAQAGRVGSVTVATNMAGRGVDIILGGNPEGLAAREAMARGIDTSTEEGAAQLAAIEAEFAAVCEDEGDEVRELGGLYVLGSERHESRRIDNQLRGRSGRQGDPGESRFFLSLEDDLMRLFATGAMNWVMGRALPDDVPIEAKMVTKAIERAQNTVEGRNAESRKDVLKYDDVMNEQRKVIYRRRFQIIEGEDLHDDTVELLETTMTDVVATSCPSEYAEEWDLPRLITEVTQYYPTKFVAEDLADASTIGQITESILTEALDLYAERDETIPGGAGDGPPARAGHHAPDHRPAVAGPPGRDGLSAGGHQPAGHGQPGPVGGLSTRGLRHVRQADGRHQRRLPALRVPRPGHDRAGRRARPRPGQLPGRRRPGPGGRRHLGGVRLGHAGGVRGGGRRHRRPLGQPGPGRGDQSVGRRRRDPAAHREVRPREDRAQRPLLLRQRQEVQALPRRQLRWPRMVPVEGRVVSPSASTFRWPWSRCANDWPRPAVSWASINSRSGAPNWRKPPPSPGCGTTPTMPVR